MPIAKTVWFDRSRHSGEVPHGPTEPTAARGIGHGWHGRHGLRTSVAFGTRSVPIRRVFSPLISPLFPDLYTDQNPAIPPFIKPRLTTALNFFSPIGHRGGTEPNQGTTTLPKDGYPPEPVPGAGMLDPVPAGRGYRRALFNPDAFPVVPAAVPLAKPASVDTTNLRGGQGKVVPQPLPLPSWPFYPPPAGGS